MLPEDALWVLPDVSVLQDRHNGNILMDVAGHIIHIDFGFMLSNSPGGVNFEAAPFKLTRELLEIMDSNSEGHASEIFDYFKVGLLFLCSALPTCSRLTCLMLHGLMRPSGIVCVAEICLAWLR